MVEAEFWVADIGRLGHGYWTRSGSRILEGRGGLGWAAGGSWLGDGQGACFSLRTLLARMFNLATFSGG